jgi:hypothetical protein
MICEYDCLGFAANFLAVPQGLLALVLCYEMWRKRTTSTTLIAVFAYSTFYFSWGYLGKAVFSIGGLTGVSRAPLLALLIGLGLPLYGMWLLHSISRRDGSRCVLPVAYVRLQYFIVACVALTFVPAVASLLLNGNSLESTWSIRWKMSLVPILSFAFAIVTARALLSGGDLWEELRPKKRRLFLLLGVLLAITSVAATYEVVQGGGANAEGRPGGLVWSRATAFLLNPNILGLWAAICALILGVAYHLSRIKFRTLFGFGGMVAYLLVLSGSRSAFLVMIVFLGASSLALLACRGRRLIYLTPLAVVLVWIGAFGISAAWIETATLRAPTNLTTNIRENSYRFYSIPRALLQYVTVPVPNTWEQEKNKASIDGRFGLGHAGQGTTWLGSGEELLLADNNYIPILELSGGISFVSWILLWVAISFYAAARFLQHRSIVAAYGLSTILGLVAGGLFLRISFLSPTWFLTAALLGLALASFFYPYSKHWQKGA